MKRNRPVLVSIGVLLLVAGPSLAATPASTAVASPLARPSSAVTVAAVAPVASDDLLGVSCPGPARCFAVGSDVNGLAVAESWDGTAWSVAQTPNPQGTSASSLEAVSCTSATACTAVGFYQTQNVFVPLIVRWNGAAWKIQPSPRPPGRLLSHLFGVSCASSNACAAVGCHFDGNVGCEATLAEVWDGSAWRITPTPRTAVSLNGVSCTSASSCIAVGVGFNDVVRVQIAQRWDGTRWTALSTPNPDHGFGQLVKVLGVSCPTSVCIAVGSYSNRLGNVVTLAERWDGTTWKILRSANPPHGGEIFLYGVSCTTATACTAVGNYQTGTGLTATLAERWNGTTWTIQPTPNPQGGQVEGLFGVSCSSNSACTAVGNNFFQPSTGNPKSLAERWNGSAWTIQPTP